MKYHIILSRAIVFLSAIFMTGTISALNVTTTEAGTLADKISDPTNVTSLSVTGPLNASDFYFIGRSLTRLTDLDLSSARIDAYAGERLEGRTSYPANVIPPLSLSGLSINRFVFPSEGYISIGDGAFAGTSLKSLTLPDNIESVGMGAYAGCKQLESLTLPIVSIGEGSFQNCTSLKTVDISFATTIPASSFRGCTTLSEIINSQNISSIGPRAFQGCTSLKSLTFGPSLVSVGNAAFASSGLTNVDLSHCISLAELGDRAFADCLDLTTVIFPPNLEKTGNGAFLGDTSLTDITVPTTLITLGHHSLAATAVNTPSLELPEGMETIGDYALAGARQIESIKLPGSLIKIGTGAMQNMTGLQRIQAEALPGPTELGSDVWHGVNQPAVTVTVGYGLVDTFKAADQWSEFVIVDPAAADDITTDNNDIKVLGRFDGSDLTIRAIGSDIDEATLYSTDGRLLTRINPGNETATIETSSYPGRVFIVNVRLTNDVTATLKLARR